MGCASTRGVKNGTIIQKFEKSESIFTVIPSTNYFLYCQQTSGKCIEIWDFRQRKQVYSFELISNVQGQSIPLIPKTKLFICAVEDKKSIIIGNWEAKTIENRIENVFENSLAIGVIPNTKFFLHASKEGQVKLLNYETKDCLHTFEGLHQNPLKAMAMISGSRYFMTGAQGELKMWDCDAKECVHSFEMKEGQTVDQIRYIQNSDYFLVLGNSELSLWDYRQQLFINTICKDVIKFDVLRNSPYLIVAQSDNSVSIIDFKMNKSVYTQKKTVVGSIKNILYIPDSRNFMTEGDDGTLKYWQIPKTVVLGTNQRSAD